MSGFRVCVVSVYVHVKRETQNPRRGMEVYAGSAILQCFRYLLCR